MAMHGSAFDTLTVFIDNGKIGNIDIYREKSLLSVMSQSRN